MKITIKHKRVLKNRVIIEKRIALIEQTYKIVLSGAQTKSDISNINNYSKIIEITPNNLVSKADRV